MNSNIAAYIRVSSKSQDHGLQRASIERAAAARGEAVGRWYGEKRSGKNLLRPELDRLRADARAGHISKLYLFRLDRLTRSGVRDTLDLVEEFRRHGVELATVSDGFDLSGPAAEIILCVMAWASRMERVAINERIAAARERVESEGRSWGRPCTMTMAARARAVALRAEGKPLREIASQLGLSKSVVARALVSHNPAPFEAVAPDANCPTSQEPPLALAGE